MVGILTRFLFGDFANFQGPNWTGPLVSGRECNDSGVRLRSVRLRHLGEVSTCQLCLPQLTARQNSGSGGASHRLNEGGGWWWYPDFWVGGKGRRKQDEAKDIYANTCEQLMVNCWFGARWFEILGVHPSNNPFHKGIPGIQTTN